MKCMLYLHTSVYVVERAFVFVFVDQRRRRRKVFTLSFSVPFGFSARPPNQEAAVGAGCAVGTVVQWVEGLAVICCPGFEPRRR